MWEAIGSGLAIAGVTASVWLAYNHPKAFRAVAPWVVVTLWIVWIWLLAWWLAVAVIWSKAIIALGYSNFLRLEPILSSMQPPAWVLVVSPLVTLAIGPLYFWVGNLKNEKP